MADSRDITGKNRKFKGTSGIVLPKGTQAQRADTESGEIRFNTDTNLAEYYDGTEWKPIDAPPTITGVSPASPVDNGSTTTEITITGSNLQSGGTLSIIGNDATEYTVSSFTRVSSSTITFDYTSALAAAGVNTPYDIKYENPSGLAATFEDGFTPNVGPVFGADAGSLGTITIGANASTFTQPNVTDAVGGTLVVSVSAGSLPGGVSLNSSNGALSGVTNAGGTFSFTLSATDGTTTITRAYTAAVVNPWIGATGGTVTESGDYKIHTFTGDGTFVVSAAGTPAGSTQVDYMVVAGGGGGSGGGGGGGGFRESHSTPVSGSYTASPLSTPTGITVTATTYPITVGGGGSGVSAGGCGNRGGNSVFATITSAGGGAGGKRCSPTNTPGGSGGGAGQDSNSSGGAGNTPPTSPPQGNSGGSAPTGGYGGSGGGGGAGGGGSNGGGPGNPAPGGNAGGGVNSAISGSPLAYSGGGGGGSNNSGPGTGGTGGSGVGGNGGGPDSSSGGSGTSNRGGGAGGGEWDGSGGTGGSGVVILRYKFQ